VKTIPTEWLTQRVENAPTSYGGGPGPADALRVRMAWQKLKRQAGEGDELWAFANPAASRGRTGSPAGYALVRDGKVVQSVVVTEE
jgi:hypothetical protein